MKIYYSKYVGGGYLALCCAAIFIQIFFLLVTWIDRLFSTKSSHCDSNRPLLSLLSTQQLQASKD